MNEEIIKLLEELCGNDFTEDEVRALDEIVEQIAALLTSSE